MGTNGNAGQQRRTIHHARRDFLWCSLTQLFLDVLPGLPGNDGGYFDADPLIPGSDGAGAAILHIEPMLAGVGFIGQDTVDAGDHERLAAKALASGVQLRDNGFHAQLYALSTEIQAKDAADEGRFGGVNLQPFFDLLAALFSTDHIIAKRRSAAVPEALAGIFLHGPCRVFADFLGGVGIERHQNAFHHLPGRVISERLGDGLHGDAGLVQGALRHGVGKIIAGEAAEAVNDNEVERPGL
nr:hypothetical protein [uncultured Acidocella sp.]